MNSRELIQRADRISKDLGYTQAAWSRAAGFDASGMTVSRAFRKGNCKLSTFVSLLDAIGYKLELKKEDESEGV